MPRRGQDDDVPVTPIGKFVRPRFGVEIEFRDRGLTVPATTIAEKLTQAGIDCQFEEYNHTTHAHWKLTTDSSCGYELVSPPLFFEDRWSIGDAMRILRESGAQINADCGFHVHHEWPWQVALRQEYNDTGNSARWDTERQGRLSQLLWMYDKFFPLIGVLIPRNRLTVNEGDSNRFTASNKGNPLSSCWSDFDGRSRYVAVNFMPLADGRNTVEFRQHQGTLNLSKAIAWLEFTRQMVAASTNTYIPREGDFPGWAAQLEELVPAVTEKLSGTVIRYMVARCADKGTAFEHVMGLVTERVPADPQRYGDHEIIDAHRNDVAATLGSINFESSDR